MARLQFVAKAEGDDNFGLKEVDIPSESGGLGFSVVHASWRGSSTFTWGSDQIASSGISDVTRVDKGIYRVSFSKDFASSNYTITTGVGSEDYKGIGASPRTLSVLLNTQTSGTVDVICERSDDSVNVDNAYMSIIAIG